MSIRVALILSMLIVLAALASAAASNSILVDRLVVSIPEDLGVRARLVWGYCGGGVRLFVQIVYPIPPGYNLEEINVHVSRLNLSVANGVFAAAIAPRLPSYAAPAPIDTPCPDYRVEIGVWRGVKLLVLSAPLYSGRGVLEKVSVKLVLSGDASQRLDQWTYGIVSRIATIMPRVWQAVSPQPYKVGLIVLTRNYLLPGIEKWVELKREQGYIVKVLTVDDVCRNLTGPVVYDLRYYIREAVRSVYEENPGLYKYLVIVGDATGDYWDTRITSCAQLAPWEVPPAYFYNPTQYDDEYSHTDGYVPTDIYYASFDGSWDADRDGVLGEYPDDTQAYDLFPDLVYVRIPVRAPDDAAMVLSKLGANTPTGHPLVLAGAILYYEGEKEDGSSQGDTMLEGLYRSVFAGKDWIEPIRLYEHYPVTYPVTSPVDLNGNLTHEAIVEVLESTRGVVAVFAHGDVSCVWRKIWYKDDGDGLPEPTEIKWESFLCGSDAATLQPQLLYVVSACLTAYYDEPSKRSMGEYLVSRGSGYIGWNRVSFGPILPLELQLDPDSWCCSDLLAYLVFKYMVGEGVSRLGDAIAAAMLDYATREPLDASGSYGTAIRRTVYAFTAMLDPTRVAYASPTRFHPNPVGVPVRPYGTASIAVQLVSVDGVPVSHAEVQVYRVENGRLELITKTYTDDYGFLKLALPAGSGATKYMLFYAGNATPPSIYEPTTGLVILNTTLAPWIEVKPKEIRLDQMVRIIGCGFPVNQKLDVYLEGLLVTELYTNGTGCIDFNLTLPYTIPPGMYRLMVVYERDPSVRVDTQVKIVYNPVLATREASLEILSRLLDVQARLAKLMDTLAALMAETAILDADVKDLGYNLTVKLRSLVSQLDETRRVLLDISENLGDVVMMLRDVKKTSRNNTLLLDRIYAGIDAVNERLTRASSLLELLKSRLDGLSSKLRERVEPLLERLAGEISEVRNTTMSIKHSLIRVFTAINETRDYVSARISVIEPKIDKLLAHVGEVRVSIDELKVGLGCVNRSMARMEEMLREKLPALVEKLSHLEERVSRVETRVSKLSDTTGKLAESIDARLGEMEMRLGSLQDSMERVQTASMQSLLIGVAILAIAASSLTLSVKR